MDNIFIKKDCVISSFILLLLFGYGCKSSEEAKKYIKHGETLNPSYYPLNKESITNNGYDHVYSVFMDRLFNEKNIDDNLTKIVGENVYKPWDCLSGIYQIEINDNMGLVARPNGITMNNNCVIMVDNYLTRYFRQNTEEELEIKLLSTMVVWKAKKGLYIIEKMDKIIQLDYDESRWNNILTGVKSWSKTIDY